MEESEMKVSLVDGEDQELEFEAPNKFKVVFQEMFETGKVLVVEDDDLDKLLKFQRSLHAVSKRYTPTGLKLQTRRNDNVLIARLVTPTTEAKSLGALLQQARKKLLKDLKGLGVLVPDKVDIAEEFLKTSTVS